MAWKILYYKTGSGQDVIKSFIDDLHEDIQAKIARQLDLLEEFGSTLGMPHARAMGGGLTELRIRGKQEIRIFYALIIGKRIYLLHGFVKKTQTTPRKELILARKRQAEVLRKYRI